MGLSGETTASMVGGTLFTYPDNFRAQKAEIAAKYSGAKLTVSKDFKFGETNKSAEFLKKFPLGKVPAFEGSDGTLLTESNAIAYYVANDELRGGSDAATRAQVVQWMSMADSDILPAACTWVFPTMGIMQYNKNATERAKDPLAALPKGTFDLEEWKRFYSNNDEDDSIKWFWEHFDAEHYSIWRSDYKFNNELTMVFMSCNLVGGMFQRLEKMKKNAFASAILFGENNNSSISGIWVWKGQELAFDLCEDWAIDSGSYDWKKLDPKSEECKNLIAQLLEVGGSRPGRPKVQSGQDSEITCLLCWSSSSMNELYSY